MGNLVIHLAFTFSKEAGLINDEEFEQFVVILDIA